MSWNHEGYQPTASQRAVTPTPPKGGIAVVGPIKASEFASAVRASLQAESANRRTDRDFPRVEGESPEDRARRLLDWLLPKYHNRDRAMDNLYFIDPDNDATRLPSIAAALWILGVRR